MYCRKCGRKNNDNSRFCAGCGGLLSKKTSIVKKGIEVTGDIAKDVVKESVKKGHSVVFKIGIASSLMALIIALANYYFTYMVSTPDGVVKTFMEATDKMDYNTMVSCFDPSTQKMVSIGGNLTMGFISSVTGFPIDYDTATTISSYFGDSMTTDEQKCHATNFKVEKIEGEKLKAFVEQFGTKVKSIGNILGSRATVSFEVDNKSQCLSDNNTEVSSEAKRIKYEIEVVNYGKNGWKIPGDINMKYVGDVK